MTPPTADRLSRSAILVAWMEAVPGVCLAVSVARTITYGGHRRIGPISVDVPATAAVVYAMMTTFDGGDAIEPDAREHVREFTTVVSLPLGIRRPVRTSEAIRLEPPNAIHFRHLSGPVRGLAEVITLETVGEGRSRVIYVGELPATGLVLRLAYRLLARPAIERIVRAHLADMVKRAEDYR